MSADWVPITRLRSGAVAVLAASTMALTSGRWATPRFLATRVAAPSPRDVAVVDHQLGDRVAAAGVDTLDDRDVADHGVGDAVGVAGDDQVDGGVLELLDDA